MLMHMTTPLWLQTEYNFNILDIHDISDIEFAPYNTIYKILSDNYSEKYSPNDRIVLYSNTILKYNVLEYIQESMYSFDIDNSFLLIVSPSDITDELNQVRVSLSTNNNSIHSIVRIPETTLKNKDVNPSLIPKPLPASFCVLAWASLKINARGNFTPCCVYKSPITDDNGSKFSVFDNASIDDVYNSTEMNELRDDFIHGKHPEKCSYCWNLENNNCHSPRIENIETFKKTVGVIDFEEPSIKNILSVDADLGSTCNLKCRICGPGLSSKIMKEELTYATNPIQIETLLKLKDENNKFNRKNEMFWNSMIPILPNVERLNFFGGEPLANLKQIPFLQLLVDKSYSKNIRLHYNTNGTLLPVGIVPVWNKFNEVDIAFSIDDTGKRFEYQRSGGLWSDVEANIDTLLSQSSTTYTFSVWATVNNQNVFYLDELLDWCNTNNFGAVHLNILESPDYLNIKYLTDNTKKIIIDKLVGSSHTKLHNVITYLQMTMGSTSKEEDFKKYIRKIDVIRNEDFSIAHSDFSNIINYTK